MQQSDKRTQAILQAITGKTVTFIQRAVRGYFCQRILQRLVKDMSAQILLEIRRNALALIIQKTKKIVERERIRQSERDREIGALQIQCMWRGFVGERTKNIETRRRKERHAAVTIQRILRGEMGCKESRRRRLCIKERHGTTRSIEKVFCGHKGRERQYVETRMRSICNEMDPLLKQLDDAQKMIERLTESISDAEKGLLNWAATITSIKKDFVVIEETTRMNPKVNITIPKIIGSSKIVETLGKFNLYEEVKEFLSEIDGRMMVTFYPGAQAPTIQIVSSKEEPICSIDEFIKLSSYCSTIATAVKEVKKETALRDKIELVAIFLRKAKKRDSINPPARVINSNVDQLRQLYTNTKIVLENLEKVEDTIDNEYQRYLSDRLKTIIGINYMMMLRCMDSSPVDKGEMHKYLFAFRIPRWIYSKAVLRSFTANLRNDTELLLFPRSKYTNAMTMTVKCRQMNSLITMN